MLETYLVPLQKTTTQGATSPALVSLDLLVLLSLDARWRILALARNSGLETPEKHAIFLFLHLRKTSNSSASYG